MADAVSHIGLTCDDPGLVEKFYADHFGFARVRVFNPGPDQITMIRSGVFYIEIFRSKERRALPPAEGTGPDYRGWKHLCISVDDLDDKLRELSGKARLTLGPLDLDDMVPGMRAAWVADPEGNIIELNQGYAD